MNPRSYVASFQGSQYDELAAYYTEHPPREGRNFYVSLGPVCTWLTIEEADDLYKQLGLSLLAYDNEAS
jgi:hypothetical protein